jgi:hypothetical protein
VDGRQQPLHAAAVSQHQTAKPLMVQIAVSSHSQKSAAAASGLQILPRAPFQVQLVLPLLPVAAEEVPPIAAEQRERLEVQQQ